VSSVRQAAAACGVGPYVVERWLSRELLPEPPWTLQQLQVRDLTDPEGRRRGSEAAHGTRARWSAGCSCAECQETQSTTARARGRARAERRLPVKVREQLLDAIYAGQPFRQAVRDLGLTSNQVWGSPRLTLSGRQRSMPL
jgi:hypothetical protein